MANAEQLALLKAGVQGWNKWREENPEAKIDLTGANLQEADLPNIDLHEANLREADLIRANLRGSNLRGANLWDADLTGANLREADLRDTDLTAANLWGVILWDTNLAGANDTYALRIPGPNYAEQMQGIVAPDPGMFTAIYPSEVPVEAWHTLLVYAHRFSALLNFRDDSRPFKDRMMQPKEVSSYATTPVASGTEITIVPTCDGVVFNPERIALKWMESFHRADFRFKAEKALANDAARGQIDIYVGPILIGGLKFALLLNGMNTRVADDQIEYAPMYRQEDIFISYSHKDSELVLSCKKAYEALGFKVLIDIDTLRSGEIWSRALLQMIDRATIFQLFWSENSSQSQYCRQEWQHALNRNKDGFIRPIYWEHPMPEPPEELSKYHFDFIEF